MGQQDSLSFALEAAFEKLVKIVRLPLIYFPLSLPFLIV